MGSCRLYAPPVHTPLPTAPPAAVPRQAAAATQGHTAASSTAEYLLARRVAHCRVRLVGAPPPRRRHWGCATRPCSPRGECMRQRAHCIMFPAGPLCAWFVPGFECANARPLRGGALHYAGFPRISRATCGLVHSRVRRHDVALAAQNCPDHGVLQAILQVVLQPVLRNTVLPAIRAIRYCRPYCRQYRIAGIAGNTGNTVLRNTRLVTDAAAPGSGVARYFAGRPGIRPRRPGRGPCPAPPAGPPNTVIQKA